MKTSFVFSMLSLAIALPLAADAQQVYRWVDAEGRVQYSDQPPPPGAKNVQEKNVGGSSIQNNELSLVAQDAQKKNPVTVYVSECGESCDAARAYLNKLIRGYEKSDLTKIAHGQSRMEDEWV